MSNYVKGLPHAVDQEVLQEFPAPVRAVETTMKENAVVSSAMLINPTATNLEISALGGSGAVIRWVPITETAAVAPRASVVASGLGANFDHHIPAGTYRRFAVPKETQGQLQGAGMQVGSVHGLYQRLAIINASAAPSSVLVVQY